MSEREGFLKRLIRTIYQCFYSEYDILKKPTVSKPRPAPPKFSVPEGTVDRVRNFGTDIQIFLSAGYISQGALRTFENKYEKQFAMLSMSDGKAAVESGVDNFVYMFQAISSAVDEHNEEFLASVMEAEKEYLDHVLDGLGENMVLDEEQRKVVLSEEENVLVVAGAGSGKTTTVAAKVKYLVDRKAVAPERILVLSFTNEAVEELKKRINLDLGINADISTFHAFGNRFTKSDGMYKSVADQRQQGAAVSDIIDGLLSGDTEALMEIILFMGYYFDIPDDAFLCKNLDEYHAISAATNLRTLRGRLDKTVCTVMNQRTKSMKTLRGEFLKSGEEVRIANFLYLNDIDYEYESRYPVPGVGRKHYTPDFLISQGDNRAYLEHFGLSEWLTSNRYSDEDLARYRAMITYKRRLHKENGTRLLETWSLYKDGRPLLEHLGELLKAEGFTLHPRKAEEIYQKIVDTDKDDYFKDFADFTKKFIDGYKIRGYGPEGFEILRGKTDNVRTLKFLEVAESVYKKYQDRLEKSCRIDFADMINTACDSLRETKAAGKKIPYDHIIVDEFQDIVRQRFNLVKAMLEASDSKVMAVGDDWQSIYAFSGSEIRLFTDFISIMGYGKELRISRTYRNSQELIDIAGRFVQENPEQIRKRLISDKHLEEPIRVRAYTRGDAPMINLATTVESIVGEILEEFGPKSKILLLGRYNFDGANLGNSGLFSVDNKGMRCLKYPEAEITFKTVHSSKGLGYDNVILINLAEGRLGFPCQIEDDPIMRLVTSKDDTIPFAEERRLMYVAMTRTRNRLYITAPTDFPSRFLIELIDRYGIRKPQGMSMKICDTVRDRCPVCGYPLRRQFNKTYGLDLFICTNDPEVCDFMTNDIKNPYDIEICDWCAAAGREGYLIVKNGKEGVMYGCTNYSTYGKKLCKRVKRIP